MSMRVSGVTLTMDVLCEVTVDVVVVEDLRGRLVDIWVLVCIWICRSIVSWLFEAGKTI